MRLEVREKSGKKYNVWLNSEPYCKCYPKDLRELGFMDASEGQETEISEDVLAVFESEVFLTRAKRRSLFLLGKKEYTQKEMAKKLSADGYPKSVVTAVLQYLEELRYINDVSYAERYAFHLLQRCSERELFQKMQQKGFERELINEALESAKERYQLEYSVSDEQEVSPEQAAIASFLRKKGFSPEKTDAEKKQKLVMSLYRKGFSLSDIRAVVGEFENESELA